MGLDSISKLAGRAAGLLAALDLLLSTPPPPRQNETP